MYTPQRKVAARTTAVLLYMIVAWDRIYNQKKCPGAQRVVFKRDKRRECTPYPINRVPHANASISIIYGPNEKTTRPADRMRKKCAAYNRYALCKKQTTSSKKE
jgi:hypothetical protein